MLEDSCRGAIGEVGQQGDPPAPLRDEVGFDQKGYLWMYDDDHWSDAVDAIKWQNAHGLGVRALTPDQVQQHCPLIDQLDGVAGATFSPRDGLLNPNLVKELYRARARAAAGGGIRFENYS